MPRVHLPLLAALLAAGLGCGRKAEAPVAPLPTATVRLVAPASSGTGWVAASLESREQAVLATRFAASVKAIPVHEGDAVKAGQLLAQLDDADLRGARDAAQDGFAAAQAQHARIAALAAQQAATQLEADQAATQLAQARAALEAARANLRYTELRAPFPGTVRSRAVEPGAFVGPGQPILTLDGVGLELRASLSDAEAAGLKTGQEIVFDVGGREGRARILALASGADPSTHRRDIRATVLAPMDLRSGAFARIRIANAIASAGGSRWLPESALVRRGGLTGAFVVEDGHAALRWLSLGDQREGRVEVRAGLKGDEAVVDSPGMLLDGQPVEAAHERR